MASSSGSSDSVRVVEVGLDPGETLNALRIRLNRFFRPLPVAELEVVAIDVDDMIEAERVTRARAGVEYVTIDEGRRADGRSDEVGLTGVVGSSVSEVRIVSF